MPDLAGLIDLMPKAELHLHIEGSLEPGLCFELARRNGAKLPYASAADLGAAYDFGNLQEFLDLYYQGMSVLLTEQDFYDLTWAYFVRMKDETVRHAEIFFDPQGHTERGIAFATVIDGIWRGMRDAESKLGVTSKLIMCFLRHLDEADAERTLDQALPYKDRIAAVGLDSSEIGHPPEKFARVFARARKEGFLAVAHAGEEGPAEYVRGALDSLKVDRIDHGNHALEDPALVVRLARDQMPLTVCPLSNLKLRGVADMTQHPLRAMLDAGLKATINSDDPAYFGGYVNANYKAVAAALNLTGPELYTLARNSFEASFITEAEKAAFIAELDAFAAAAGWRAA